MVMDVLIPIGHHRPTSVPSPAAHDVDLTGQEGIGGADDRADVEVMLQVLYGDMEEVTSRIKLRDDGLELPVPEFVDNIAAITLGQQGLVKAGVSGPWMRMWANSY